MSFWSNSVSEPRRNFKFLLRVQNIPVWVVKNVNLPKITLQEGKHQFLNHTFYFPGTVEYNTVSFTIIDSIGDDISKKILQNFVGGGYNTPSSEIAGAASLITKGDSVGALGMVSIAHLGSGQDGVEDGSAISFSLTNAWIQDVEFSSALAYDSDEPSEIKVQLRYDFFEFLDGAGVAMAGFGGEAAASSRK